MSLNSTFFGTDIGIYIIYIYWVGLLFKNSTALLSLQYSHGISPGGRISTAAVALSLNKFQNFKLLPA